MDKILVSYFSASGNTRKAAEKIANTFAADLFEIEPVNPYTLADLDWRDKKSRSTIEMNDKSFRPQIRNKVDNIKDYDTIFLGFPIWWYTAPTIINTFIEENDLSNKSIYIFITSGGSSFDKPLKDLKSTYPEIKFISGIRLTGRESKEDINNLVKKNSSNVTV